MCLMLRAMLKRHVPADYLQNAYDHNSDGWGIMWARDGRVQIVKERADFAGFKAAWDAAPDDLPLAAHFRFGTSGPKSGAMCHPFKVLDARKHGTDLYMMHNGVMSGFRGDANRSDTLEMVEEVLRPMLKGNVGFIKTDAFKRIALGLIGKSNKLMFLEGSGEWHFVNREAGSKIGRVWYSNEYSLEKVYSGHGKGRAAVRTPPTAVQPYSGHGQGYYGNDLYSDLGGGSCAWTPPEHKPRPHALLAAHNTGSAQPARVIHAHAKETAASGPDGVDIMIPKITGPETVQIVTSTMREKTLETLSDMGALPPCPPKVAAAIVDGATLDMGEDTLQANHGISLFALASYIKIAASHMIATARGKTDGVLKMKAAAEFALTQCGTMGHASDKSLDKLAEEARTGQGALAADYQRELVSGSLVRDANSNLDRAREAQAEIMRPLLASDVEFWEPDHLTTLHPDEIMAAIQAEPGMATDYIVDSLDFLAGWQH